jgi:uncharacterized membrane-anchored protein YitT (DUF2179 family)
LLWKEIENLAIPLFCNLIPSWITHCQKGVVNHMELLTSSNEMEQMEKPRKLIWLNTIKRIFFILVGAFLFSLGLEVFLVPNQVIDGGIVGISIIISHLTQWNLGLLLVVFNLPFLFLGYKQIGKTFAFSTMFGIVVMSVFTNLFHSIPAVTKDPLLAAVFGGIILGVGVGLVIRYGGSLDGTEILAILINKKVPFSVGQIVMFANLFILSSAGFVFSWDRAMYSLITYFIAVKMIDIVIEGFEEMKSVWIISDKIEIIGQAISNRLGRGVTYLAGEGGYSGENKKVIFCIITRLEEAKLKSIVEDIDPNAFLATGNIHDVQGGSFKKKDIH